MTQAAAVGVVPQWMQFGNELVVRDTGIIIPPQTSPQSALSCFTRQERFRRSTTFFDHIKEFVIRNSGGRLMQCKVKDGGDYSALLYEFFRMFGQGAPCDVSLANSIADWELALNLPQIEEVVQRHFAGSHDLGLNENGGDNYFLTHNGEQDIRFPSVSIVSVERVLHAPMEAYAVDSQPIQGIIGTVCDEGDNVYFLEGLMAAR